MDKPDSKNRLAHCDFSSAVGQADNSGARCRETSNASRLSFIPPAYTSVRSAEECGLPDDYE